MIHDLSSTNLLVEGKRSWRLSLFHRIRADLDIFLALMKGGFFLLPNFVPDNPQLVFSFFVSRARFCKALLLKRVGGADIFFPPIF